MLVFFLYHLNLLQGSGLVLFLHLSEGKQSQINLPSMVWLHTFEAKQYHFFYLFPPGPKFSSLGHYHGPLQNSPLFCFISPNLWSNRLDDGSAPKDQEDPTGSGSTDFLPLSPLPLKSCPQLHLIPLQELESPFLWISVVSMTPHFLPFQYYSSPFLRESWIRVINTPD